MNQAADNQLLVKALKSGDTRVVQQVYAQCFPMVAAYVQANSGTVEDAEDVFQEAWLVLLGKIKNPDFTLTSLVSTYVFSVAKNIWLHTLRTKRTKASALGNSVAVENIMLEQSNEAPQPEPEILVQNWLQKITKNCQAILTSLFLNNTPMSRLMQTMGWKNKHTAANQKYKCLQQMKTTALQEVHSSSKK